MRTAADILSSPAAMQIRYLEVSNFLDSTLTKIGDHTDALLQTMQAMAKTSNSKVIFLPAQNQTVQSQLAQAENVGEGPSRYQGTSDNTFMGHGQGQGQEDHETGMTSAVGARNIENI